MTVSRRAVDQLGSLSKMSKELQLEHCMAEEELTNNERRRVYII